MKTYITVEGLKIYARHGVLEQERRAGNLFDVTIRLGYDFLKAAKTDSLENTINYAEVVEIAQSEMSQPSKLLENVAWRIYEAITLRWPEIEEGQIRITKLHPPISAQTDGCSVEMHW